VDRTNSANLQNSCCDQSAEVVGHAGFRTLLAECSARLLTPISQHLHKVQSGRIAQRVQHAREIDFLGLGMGNDAHSSSLPVLYFVYTRNIELITLSGLRRSIISTLPINSAADESAKRAEGISNVALVRAAFEAWTAGTGSPFELLAENVSWRIIGGTAVSKTYATRDAFNREVTQPFNSRMSSPLLPPFP
jgi:hypothetical protein